MIGLLASRRSLTALEDKLNQAFIRWDNKASASQSQERRTEAENNMKTGASVPENLFFEEKPKGAKNIITKVNEKEFFEKMQNEVPNYLKLDTKFDFVGRGLTSNNDQAATAMLSDTAVSDDTDDLMQENAI